jgi:hypothetical protein
VGVNLQSWHNLVMRIADIHLNDQPDIFRWSLTSSGQFMVSSMYQTMIDLEIVSHNIYLWKLKILLKIKFLLWLLCRKVIITNDNLVKRNWHGNEACCFCHNHETIQHLFLYCDLPNFIWKVLYFTYGLEPPSSINHMFGTWILNMNTHIGKLFLVGISVMMWAIWLHRNDIAFDKK